jgi:hypothetical protein
MGDAPRQCAQALELLRTEARLFQAFALGYVRHSAHHVSGFAGFVLVLIPAGPNPSNRLVRAHNPEFKIPPGALLYALFEGFSNPLLVLRMNMLHKNIQIPFRQFFRIPEDAVMG